MVEGAAPQVHRGIVFQQIRVDGIASGEVEIGPYNPKIPADVVAAADKVKADIASGTLHPFAGPINDNTGAERVAAGDVIDDGEFWAVDWYVEGVEA